MRSDLELGMFFRRSYFFIVFYLLGENSVFKIEQRREFEALLNSADGLRKLK